MTPLAEGLTPLMPQIAAERPSVGKWVRVEFGKRRGAEGIVRRHIVNRYSGAWKYGSGATDMLRDLRGQYGFRVQIETANHGTFWADADKVTVIGGEVAR